ncbi:hypothetical protein ACFSQ7_13960 [Paenibacillus rhizoplanae]
MISQVAAADSSKVFFCREEELDEYLMNKFNWYRAKYYQVKKTALIFTSPVPADYLEIVQDSNGFQLKDRKDESHEI